MQISLVVDNPSSWFILFAENLCSRLAEFGEVKIRGTAAEIPEGNEIAFLLSCEKKVSSGILTRSRHNIVVHASDLPQGKGMSPLTWQILEGRNEIPVSLFEAVEEIDAGPVYIKDAIHYQGNELLNEMQTVLGEKIIEMCLQFIRGYPAIVRSCRPQSGPESFYRRRKPQDSQLDPNKTIAEQFNLLRVADNDRYPAFFEWNGRKFLIKIIAAIDG
jgi:methionyl-tRNA formyltransferase